MYTIWYILFIYGMFTFFIDKELNIFLLVFALTFLFLSTAFLKYLDIGFIRKSKPEFTIALFIEIIFIILNEHRNELACDVQPQERQLWRKKIYVVCYRYKNIFLSDNEFLPALIVPLSDPDEFDLPPLVEECVEVMSLSFELIDQSGIYDKYIEYDEDELLTIVHFADLLINFWAENQIKLQNKNTPTSGLKLNITDKIGYHE